MQAGCKIYLKKRKADWLNSLLQSKFFGSCVHHQNNRKNEKNVFCIDCGVAICRHCLISHCVHRRLQICKYVYQYVVRVPDLQNLLDCCSIQVYLYYLLKLYKFLVLKFPCLLLLVVVSCDKMKQEPFQKPPYLSYCHEAEESVFFVSFSSRCLITPEEQPQGSIEFNHKRELFCFWHI